MRFFSTLATLAAALALVNACSATQTAKTTAALKVACQIDGQVQPVAVPLAAAVVPQVAGITSIDQQLVHPAVVAACAALSAKPVAAP